MRIISEAVQLKTINLRNCKAFCGNVSDMFYLKHVQKNVEVIVIDVHGFGFGAELSPYCVLTFLKRSQSLKKLTLYTDFEYLYYLHFSTIIRSHLSTDWKINNLKNVRGIILEIISN